MMNLTQTTSFYVQLHGTKIKFQNSFKLRKIEFIGPFYGPKISLKRTLLCFAMLINEYKVNIYGPFLLLA